MLKDAQPVLDRLTERERERAFLLAVLRLWKVVEDAGICIDDVKSFTFRPEFLSKEEARQYRNSSYKAKCDVSKYWHNCVRLKDMVTLKPIPLTASPKCLSPFSGTSAISTTSVASTPPSEHA